MEPSDYSQMWLLCICMQVEPFLYNKGAGRYIPISKIVLVRNKERARYKQLPEIRAMENPDEDFDINQHLPEVSEAEYLANPTAYRDVCWDLTVAINEQVIENESAQP